MNGKMILLATLTVASGMFLHGHCAAEEFETATIHLERNVVDDDAEAVIEVKGGDEGLSRLVVFAPDGRRIVNYHVTNRRNLGGREILIESPEPSPAIVLAAYPEGTYRFVATTFSGETLEAEAELVHDFPPAPTVTAPADGATDVALGGVVIRWDAVPGATRYFLELEHEETETALTVQLPATATSFTVPGGWLLADSEYVIGLGSFDEGGNSSFTETSFTTENP